MQENEGSLEKSRPSKVSMITDETASLRTDVPCVEIERSRTKSVLSFPQARSKRMLSGVEKGRGAPIVTAGAADGSLEK